MADIRVVSTPQDIDICLSIRRTVFIEEQNVPEHEEVDGEDSSCTHFLVFFNGEPVGAARFKYLDDKAKIQRVCILPQVRGTGLGAELMMAILEEVKRQGKASTAILGSQTHALGFYEKLGFSAFGAEYMDAGIPHRDMQIAL